MQQAMLALHRMREQLVKFRTMQINGLRGRLTEYGEVTAKGRASVPKQTGSGGKVSLHGISKRGA
ncbi:transposase [Paraburkholderia sp. MM5496-R1]